MTNVVGGLRARLIRESVYDMIHGAIDALGWFDNDRQHSPLTFNSDEIGDPTAVPVNTAALADFDLTDSEEELGSLFSENRWTFYVDFFAESQALGLHFTRDVKDILQGRMASIGRGEPIVSVYDYREATPPVLFYCEIEDVIIDRPDSFRSDVQKSWYTVRFTVVDYYTNEEN